MRTSLCYPPPDGINKKVARNPGDVPVVRSIYIAYAYWHELQKKFPKTQRYLLGTECARYALGILELTLAAAQTSEAKEKATSLRQASVKLDTLKLLVRLSKNCKCISNTAYLQMESQLHEIGRMLGGWLKSVA